MPRSCDSQEDRKTGRGEQFSSNLPLAYRVPVFLCILLTGCNWNPSKPFEREAPQVKEAIALLDAGKAPAAAMTLEDYLSTGACAEGSIGAPEALKKLSNGTFDLGLSLFKIGESFGRRFGEEELDGGADDPQRKAQIECALRIVREIASDDTQPLELRARARYLEGNLLFLGAQYEEAVQAYDKALVLAPGIVDAGDPVGRDAAWNRAIALRRIDDKKDAGNDAAPDAPNDAPQDAPRDAPNESGNDGGNDGGDSGGNDAGTDAPHDPPDAAPPPPPDGGAPPPRADQDERTLDQLEAAPTLQQEVLKRQAGKQQRGRGMVDK